jgi:hypothetical protein
MCIVTYLMPNGPSTSRHARRSSSSPSSGRPRRQITAAAAHGYCSSRGKRFVTQAKNKSYVALLACALECADASPKYRLIVRFTNKDIVCQIVYARLPGDLFSSRAHSRVLPQDGIKYDPTQWAAGLPFRRCYFPAR